MCNEDERPATEFENGFWIGAMSAGVTVGLAAVLVWLLFL